MSVSGEPSSPFYPYGGGVALTIATVFILGFLATRAEPALNVLGKTVEQLSKGAFSKKLLVYAVCVGVAVGMSAGATKILFGASLIGFILASILPRSSSPTSPAKTWRPSPGTRPE